jgi:hypothetical protein
MHDLYPLAVTLPNPNPSAKSKDGGRPFQVVVKTPAEHKARFPEHFKTFSEKEALKASGSGQALSQAEALERERCAKIAESHKNGKVGSEIAKMIRQSGPPPSAAWDDASLTAEAEEKAKLLTDAPPVDEGFEFQPGAPLPGTALTTGEHVTQLPGTGVPA